ncbi:MAG: DUF3500 domain-containing protein, partial [Planctomycetia bacterium]
MVKGNGMRLQERRSALATMGLFAAAALNGPTPTVGAAPSRESLETTADGMAAAADAFLATLTSEQRGKAVLSFDDPARRDWHYIPKANRKGLQLREMTADQKKAALALMRTGTSDVGYRRAVQIMNLESYIAYHERNKENGAVRDPERYYFAVQGTPGATGKWAWSVEGHHLSLNYTIVDGRVAASTPTFYGVNPAVCRDEVPGGPPMGLQVLAAEERLAFELLASLSSDQRTEAMLSKEAPLDIRDGGKPNPPQGAPE